MRQPMIDLYGYEFSVYAWIARFACHEKAVEYRWIEIDPFASDVDPNYLAMHPFSRVPTLVDGSFTLYETGAITRYLDAAFDGVCLMPEDPRQRARVDQVMSIVDSYTYWPLVRQVFSHGSMRPRLGRPFDIHEIGLGLKSAERTLDALDSLFGGDGFFVGRSLTLADIHLAPMLSYFSEVTEGADALRRRPKIDGWLTEIGRRGAFMATKPMLPPPPST